MQFHNQNFWNNCKVQLCYILRLTFQFGPISNCVLNLTLLLRRSSSKWIYTRSLKGKLQGLDGSFKSFTSLTFTSLFFMTKVKILARFKVPVMFIHRILFNLIVKQCQILKDQLYFSYSNITLTPHFEEFTWQTLLP